MSIIEFEDGFSDLVTETLGDISLTKIEEYFASRTLFQEIKSVLDSIPSMEEIEKIMKLKNPE